MKVKRFLATSVAAALAQVKDRLGVDAVILSNRSTPDGVEVLAIAESDMLGVAQPDEAALAAAEPPPGFSGSFKRGARKDDAGEGEPAEARPVTSPRAAAPARPPRDAQPAAVVEHFASAAGSDAPRVPRAAEVPLASPPHFISANATVRPIDFVAALRGSSEARSRAPSRAHAERAPVMVKPLDGAGAGEPPAAPAAASSDAAWLAELRSLRRFVEERFSSMTLSSELKRRPLAASLMRELLAAGFSTALARAASNGLPESLGAVGARDWLTGKLRAKLRAASAADDIVERGGLYALTGPTGVGKTTTTAKIAARAVVKYGADSLGLITTDTYRIGAQDQLRVFGKILGVPVYAAHDALGLEQTLAQLRGKRLVLVDTIGLAQRDERVAEQIELLDAAGVERVVLLAATGQLETLEDVVRAYGHNAARGLSARGAIVTKVDEAAKLGSTLDVLIRHQLLVHYVGTGQRVPEDLASPDVDALVAHSLRVPRSGPFALSREEAGLIAVAAGQDPVFTEGAQGA